MTPESLEHVIKGQAAWVSADTNRARLEFLEAARFDASPYVIGKIRDFAKRGGDAGSLAAALEQALAEQPSSLPLMRLLAETWTMLGEGPRALDLYGRIRVLDPGDLGSAEAAAELSRRGGDLAGAEKALAGALTDHPGDPRLLYRLAQVRLEMGRPGEAEALFKKAHAADPSQFLPVLALGVLYKGSGRGEEAGKLYAEHLARFPSSLPMRRERAEWFAGLSRWAEAESDYRRIVEAGFAGPSDFGALGSTLMAQGNAAGALTSYDQGLERHPGSSVLRLRKVQALGQLGRVDEALDLLAALRKNPGADAADLSPSALSQQEGLLRYRLEDSKGALSAFRRAAEEDPASAEAAYARGAAAILAGESAEAEAAFDKSIELDPHQADAAFQLGLLHEKRGDRAGAESSFRAVLREQPEHAEALNALGYSLAESGRELGEAESLIRRALRERPRSGAFMDSLGWVHFKAGKFKDAEKELRQAAAWSEEEGGQDPVILNHLGELLEALGRKEEAGAARERAARPGSGGEVQR